MYNDFNSDIIKWTIYVKLIDYMMDWLQAKPKKN